jgi:ribosome biogenesis GTPase A
MTETGRATNGLEVVQERRGRILSEIEGLIEILESLQMHDRAQALRVLQERVNCDSFKVLFMGEFKRGKSTLINALLGERVLPAAVIPTTATINEVKWGERKRAVLHPRSNGATAQPREVPIEELQQHVTVGADEDDDVINPYEKVEVFFPLELCKDGVEVIDSPGLNDVAGREQITNGYLQEVDAIVMVFDANMLGSKSELDTIDNVLRPLGHRQLFLVVNRINLVEPDERSGVMQFGRKRIGSRTTLADGVFFVDALGALKAKLNHDPDALDVTGVPRFERALERFLARDRGRIKILAPAHELNQALWEIRDTEIPQRETMLELELADVEQRAEEAQPSLAGLEDARAVILGRLDAVFAEIRRQAEAEARTFYRAVVEQIPAWAADLDAKTEFKLFKNRVAREELSREVAAHLQARIGERVAGWQHETLEPVLTAGLDDVREELDTKLTLFLEQASRARSLLAGDEERQWVSLPALGQSPLGQILAAGGALSLSGPSDDPMASFREAQDVLGRLGPSVAAGVGAVVILGPGAIVLSLAALTQAVFRGGGKSKLKAQAQAGKRAAAELRGAVDVRAAEVADMVTQRFEEIREQIGNGLEHEIVRVREQIDVVLAAKQAGEDRVRAERDLLRDARQRLDRVSRTVSGLLEELVAERADD